jgi:integrase
MATFRKYQSTRGTRWTARVRINGHQATDTFSTKAAAESWARAQEIAFERGEYRAPQPGSGPILADAIDALLAHRKRLKRAPGKTFANALARLKKQHGLKPLSNLSVAFWRKHALDRIAEGASGSTAASDLAYATSILRHATREGHAVDAAAPGKVRTMLREDGVRVVSRERSRRLTDAEIKALLDWIDANKSRTSLPMRDLVEFALATGMRRGEILALKWTDVDGRVARIKRKHPTERERIEDVPLLRLHAQWPKVDALAIIERQPKRGPRVFPYLGDTLGFWFEKATEGAGVDGVVFHLLRHECLSRLAERGFDPLRLALVGGHRDLRNVKRYARLDAARLADE